MMHNTTIIDACHDPKLFAQWLRNKGSWDVWLIFLAALFALPMTPQQLTTYQACTGRELPPTTSFFRPMM
jgi:hypothetical protein